MARKKVAKKRISVYQLTDRKANDAKEFYVKKFEVVRGESFISTEQYTITDLENGSHVCTCPARVSPCRHVKMYLYARVTGFPKGDTYIYWEADEKEPEMLSGDDIRDIWEIPDTFNNDAFKYT